MAVETLPLSVSGVIIAGAVFYFIVKSVKNKLKQNTLRSSGNL